MHPVAAGDRRVRHGRVAVIPGEPQIVGTDIVRRAVRGDLVADTRPEAAVEAGEEPEVVQPGGPLARIRQHRRRDGRRAGGMAHAVLTGEAIGLDVAEDRAAGCQAERTGPRDSILGLRPTGAGRAGSAEPVDLGRRGAVRL